MSDIEPSQEVTPEFSVSSGVLLMEDASDCAFVQTVTTHPLLSVNACFYVEQLVSAVEWELPDFIFLDADCLGERLAPLLDMLCVSRWYIPIILSTSSPHDLSHPHPYLIAVSPLISSEDLTLRTTWHKACWHYETPKKPLALVDYLQHLCRNGRSTVVVCDLSNTETAILEIMNGELWNATISNLFGVSALKRINRYSILSSREMDVSATPSFRKIKEPWRTLVVPVEDAFVPNEFLEDRETRSNIHRDDMEGLLLTTKEDMFLESLAQASTLDKPHAFSPGSAEWTESDGGANRLGFQLLAHLVEGERAKAGAVALRIEQEKADAVCLQSLWGRVLLATAKGS